MTKENTPVFDHSRLAMLIEGGIGRRECAKRAGIGERRLARLLDGAADFRQCEIERIAAVLMLRSGDISAYFFTPKFRNSEI